MFLKPINIFSAVVRKSSNNAVLLPMVQNRNPRNLERLRLARKPVGYYFDKKNVEFWYKLVLVESNKYVTASLEHNTGTVVVSVSTKEWALAKFLYSCKDTCAHITLAKVFAERCLESGLTHCSCQLTPDPGTKAAIFLDTVQKEGMTLQEPEPFNVHNIWYKKPERKPWLVQED